MNFCSLILSEVKTVKIMATKRTRRERRRLMTDGAKLFRRDERQTLITTHNDDEIITSAIDIQFFNLTTLPIDGPVATLDKLNAESKKKFVWEIIQSCCLIIWWPVDVVLFGYLIA